MKVPSGEADLWTGLQRVWLSEPGGDPGAFFAVEAARAYRDRLVLKLAGIDDASRAEALRGRNVQAAATEAPALPEGRYYRSELVGMEVRLESGSAIGRVSDVRATGGPDLLAVTSEGAAENEEILIPLVAEIVLRVDEERRQITVRPPAGLLDLNRKDAENGT